MLSFKEAPNYEVKDNYSISLVLNDAIETVKKDIDIIIDDVNEAPKITNLILLLR